MNDKVNERGSQAFIADLPEDPVTPVVVSVPHAGTATSAYSSPLDQALDVRCDADLYVDELYQGAPAGAFVRARLSRFVCDLNRHPDDVSTRAVPEHAGARNKDGRGFIWEVTTSGTSTLRRPLTLDEWSARKAVHDAYYGALATALDRARRKFGFAILVDGHSMPSVGRSGHADPGKERADIVPGDRQGTSCSPALSRAVGDFFRGRGYSVSFNDPYKGGFITQHHGRPSEDVHAIQIEMRRDLYMNEATFEPKAEGFARLRASLAELLRVLDRFDPR